MDPPSIQQVRRKSWKLVKPNITKATYGTCDARLSCTRKISEPVKSDFSLYGSKRIHHIIYKL